MARSGFYRLKNSMNVSKAGMTFSERRPTKESMKATAQETLQDVPTMRHRPPAKPTPPNIKIKTRRKMYA